MTVLDIRNLKGTGLIPVVIKQESDTYIGDPVTRSKSYLKEEIFNGYLRDVPFEYLNREILGMAYVSDHIQIEII